MSGMLIIGNGIAGTTAAFTLRQLDSVKKITIITDEKYPLYTICALPHFISDEIEKDGLMIKTPEDYEQSGIQLLTQKTVSAIDPKVRRAHFSNGDNLSYDSLVLATGSYPLRLPLNGVELPGVFFLKTLDDAKAIASYPCKKAVVVGSGAVGIETALSLMKNDVEVTIVELLDRILPRALDKKPADVLSKLLGNAGIRVLTSEKLMTISGNKRVAGVTTDKREIPCDLVVLGAGMRPNVSLAKDMGCTIGETGGIKVDEYMKTSINDVYACGDCVETNDMFTNTKTLSMLWNNAKRQGNVVGYNLAGIAKKFPGSENITSLECLGVHVSSFGILESGTNGKGNTVEIHRGSCHIWITLIDDRIVGAQSIGECPYAHALLYAIKRKESIPNLKTIISNPPDISLLPPGYIASMKRLIEYLP